LGRLFLAPGLSLDRVDRRDEGPYRTVRKDFQVRVVAEGTGCVVRRGDETRNEAESANSLYQGLAREPEKMRSTPPQSSIFLARSSRPSASEAGPVPGL